MASPSNRAFKVEGFDELFKAMDELALEIGKTKTDKIWKKALGYAFMPVLEAAKNNAPSDSGQLREHIYMKVQRPQSRDKASNKYQGETFMARVTVGPKREESVEHTKILKKGKEKTIYNHRPVALAMEFGTAETSAQPFMRPALENNVDRVISRLGYSVMAAIEAGKWVKQKG
jgi:HK97 gp10 family phage protein